MKSAKTVLGQYLKNNGMLHSRQREQILDIFLKTEKHVTIGELYDLARKKMPKIGLATVYRTMKLICGANLAREVDFGDGVKHFEHEYGHRHHHHLICLKCGRVIEIVSPEIEKLQQRLASKHGFTPVKDTMKIFGICRQCQSKTK